MNQISDPVEVLDLESHRNVRIKNSDDAQGLAPKQLVQLIPSELVKVAREYPIFLSKNHANGKFEFHALLGIDEQENLFLDESGSWKANYIPLDVRRMPFGIGLPSGGTNAGKPVLTIDMASPCVAHGTSGEAIFLESGNFSPLLEEAISMLDELLEGARQSAALAKVLLKHDLVEPLEIKIKLADGRAMQIGALYSINEDRLRALDDSAILELHRNDALKMAYLVAASVGNIRQLIERKNGKILRPSGSV